MFLTFHVTSCDHIIKQIYCLVSGSPWLYFSILLTILVIIFWNFKCLQYKFDSSQVKRNLISRKRNLVYEFSYELPNDLRLSISGNQEMLERSQIKLEAQPSAQSPFQKLILVIAGKKHAKVDIKLFLSCPLLLDFCYFVPNIFIHYLRLVVVASLEREL